MPHKCIFALSLALIIFAGCTVGSVYKRPEAVPVMPDAYKGAKGWKIAVPQAGLPKGPWWEVFNDEKLNQMETSAASSNQDIKAAYARLTQARATAGIARSGLFPNIDASFAATRQKDSASRPLATTGKAADTGFTYNNFSLPVDLDYEIDLWGRVKNQIELENAYAEASAADLETARLAVHAEVAVDYFTIRALDSEKNTLLASIEAYRRSLDLTRQRRRAGLASDFEVAQADTVLNSALAQLPDIARRRLQFENALAVLTGQAASAFRFEECALDGPPPLIQSGLPSTLLERRPDIAAAERRMAAANAKIGVAKAAFFPDLRLGVRAGLQAIRYQDLFDWPSRLWAVGPSMTIPLFEGGRLAADVRAQNAKYEEAVASYRQTVLKAFQEVEDNLAAQQLLKEQYDQETAAWQSAIRQLEIATDRYKAGLASYLQVTTAQTVALEHERRLKELSGQRFVACVLLVKSLGGSWQTTGL
jgi:multidrug efflux system outer membrane protein